MFVADFYFADVFCFHPFVLMLDLMLMLICRADETAPVTNWCYNP